MTQGTEECSLAATADSRRQAALPARRSPASSVKIDRPSRSLLDFFDVYLQFFVRRHFHAIRLAGAEYWKDTQRPLVVCLNHASWWDPLTSILLSRHLDVLSDHYAPMDALACERYGFFRRLGLFPVEQGTTRGAAQFMRAAAQIFKDRNAVLWMTPQGSFTDVRTRPVAFRSGLDALLRRVGEVTVLPLAIEYTFWDERLPEALALLGEPLVFRQGRLMQPGYETGALRGYAPDKPACAPGLQVAAALEQTQDTLARMAAMRDPALFTPVLTGFAGTSGIYGVWQRFRARVRGEQFEAEHGSLRTPASR